jgi:hypothetical protein
MKKLIISLLLTIFMVSCATVQNKKPDPYPQISIENIKNKCEPSETWTIGILGLPAFVLRFDNCLDVNFLLAVSADTENLTKEIRHSSINLLALHYLEYLKQFDENKNKKYSIKKIKEELGEGWVTYFFAITYKETKEEIK